MNTQGKGSTPQPRPHGRPHGRQNGGAKAKATHGPPADSGSAVHRARLAAEELSKAADKAATQKARAQAEREAQAARQEARTLLALQVKQAETKPGFFYPRHHGK